MQIAPIVEETEDATPAALQVRVGCRELRLAVEKAASATAGSQGAPSLQSVLVGADQDSNTLTIAGYNLKVCIQIQMNASVQASGQFLVEPGCLMALLSQIPEETFLNLRAEQGLLKLSCAGICYEERTGSAHSYPELPALDSRISSARQYSLPAAGLAAGLGAVGFIVEPDESKINHAVLLQLWRGEDGLDGFALLACRSSGMALYTAADQAETQSPNFQFLLPPEALPTVRKLCYGAATVACRFDQALKLLQFETCMDLDDEQIRIGAIVRLREGVSQFPNLRSCLPNHDQPLVMATLDYRQLADALARQEATKGRVVDLAVRFDQVDLTTQGDVHARRVSEQIGADTALAGAIPVPIKLLAQALKALEAEQVRLILDSQIPPERQVGDGQEHRLTVQFLDRDLTIVMMRMQGQKSGAEPAPSARKGKSRKH